MGLRSVMRCMLLFVYMFSICFLCLCLGLFGSTVLRIKSNYIRFYPGRLSLF